MIFSPFDPVTYMPIFEEYDFRKKGLQQFEVMIPYDVPMPVVRDKVEIRYLNEEYIPAMGRRIECENYSLRCKATPEIIVSVSKDGRILVAVEIKDIGRKWTLVRYHRKYEGFFEFFRISSDGQLGGSSADLIPDIPEERISDGVVWEELFFDGSPKVLSGRLSKPDGDGPFPAVIMVSSDGPMTNGEKLLVEALSVDLVAAGVIVFDLDFAGQGKSQGDFRAVSDQSRVENIVSAVSFLSTIDAVDKDSLSLMGFGTGGYLALKAGSESADVSSCVL